MGIGVHSSYEFTEHGYQVKIASPDGGKLEIDSFSAPRDLSGYSANDLISLEFLSNPRHIALIENIKSDEAKQIANTNFITGGDFNPLPCETIA